MLDLFDITIVSKFEKSLLIVTPQLEELLLFPILNSQQVEILLLDLFLKEYIIASRLRQMLSQILRQEYFHDVDLFDDNAIRLELLSQFLG